MNRRRSIIPLFLTAVTLLLWTCDSIDCTLNNIVLCRANFYGSDGSAVSITAPLTVTTCGVDSVLINQQSGTSEMKLPLSYWQNEDTLVLTVTGDDYSIRDTIWIAKTNTPHFESPDCPTSMFHIISEVRTTHSFIDSVTIIKPLVNYEETENLQIYLRTAAD